jgi:hypothetical protein
MSAPRLVGRQNQQLRELIKDKVIEESENIGKQ